MRFGRRCVQIICLAAVTALAAALFVSGWSGWSQRARREPVAPAPAATSAELPAWFRDVTEESGLHFTYRNGQEADQFTMLETLGGGVALLDYDGDGLLDIFVTGGGYFDGPDRREIKGYASRLYKNLGGWRFRDVTHEVGLDEPLFYTHGCAVADYDCDGWPDLLVTGWGRMALYHNEPDGKGGRRFREVSARAGLPTGLWTTSAAWADLDGDGYPDLYVCQYLDWSPSHNPICNPGRDGDKPRRDVCPPREFKGLPHKLFRNNGNGTFSDVSDAAGLKHPNDGRGLGVLIVDVDGDGLQDICVGNDEADNFLYMNRSVPGRLRFEEKALASGIARDDQGRVNGSMGIAAADYDGTGHPSIFITTFENEQHALFRNLGFGQFLHSSESAGIRELPAYLLGWGTAFIDIDHDGWEDLVIVHGHIQRYPAAAAGQVRVAQNAVLLSNQGDGRFKDVSTRGGTYFTTPHRGRGLAFGDLDNDGWPDLVISNVNEPVAALRNEKTAGHHWLGVELVGKDHRDITGAKLTLEVEGRTLTRFVTGGGSYLSAVDRRVRFGLGWAEKIGRLTVEWPSGEPRRQEWEGLGVDRYHRLIQGEAAPRETSRPSGK
jgi:hypothetical protein